ncbi:MAG: sporulation membrane protein YtaF [Eubacteriaceae bacterium]|nr:sporulation membrane protein YtaF [Eubacteriaceae bacterium]
MIQILLITAICVDAFITSFAYGAAKTKIPLLSIAVISIICTAVFALSLSIGTAASQIIPQNLSKIICFAIFLVLGITKSCESLLKGYINKHQKSNLKLKLFDINFVLTVYADSSKADIDNSKILSAKEAVYLALALSFDNFAAGFGFALASINYLHIIILSLALNTVAVGAGHFLGEKLTQKSKKDFSWIGGIMLVILAITKLK